MTDMTPLQAFVLAFVEGLVVGVFPFLLLMRGFFGAYFGVRFRGGRYLLRLHMEDGSSVLWRVGIPRNNVLVYKLGKEEYVISLVKGVSKRQWGVNVVDVPHGGSETAPFCYEKIQVFEKEVEFQDVDDNGNLLVDKDKKPIIVKRMVPEVTKFLGWDDSGVIMTAIRVALMQPRKGIGLGNIDFKKLLWVLIIVGGAAFLVLQVFGNNTPPTV